MKKLIKFSIILFCIFIYSNNLLARRYDFELNNTDISEEDYSDDFYDLDYEPETQDNELNIWDPWEGMNRKIFEFNIFLMRYLAKPLYYNVYEKFTTPSIRQSVHNFVSNLKLPLYFANYILQLDFDNAMKSLYSFSINTIYGIFGIFDVAGYQKTTPPSTDLGITLAKYHVPSGPFIMLPFLGPNDIRGTLTWGTEVAVDPFNLNLLKIGGKRELLDEWVIFTRDGLYVVDTASYAVVNFYDLMESSFDPYILMRNAYAQSQAYKIKRVRGK